MGCNLRIAAHFGFWNPNQELRNRRLGFAKRGQRGHLDEAFADAASRDPVGEGDLFVLLR
jgi:hypothetical protein